ncbi:MAG: hypothetical protein GVY18_12630, partial [Bacteroidetes bacterium]|nr:hypothetical protein [Bacteroidota bacterium]
MEKVPDTEPLGSAPAVPSWRPWGVVFGVLLLALTVTVLARLWHVDRVGAAAEQQQRQVVQAAFRYVEQQFEGVQQLLLRRAETLAASTTLGQRLRSHGRGEPEATEALVRQVAALEVSQRMAVEVIDAEGRLVAWNGFSMPRTTDGV